MKIAIKYFICLVLSIFLIPTAALANCNLECVMGVANSYLDGLANPAKIDAIKFADNVFRNENGIIIDRNKAEAIANLKATSFLVTGLREIRLFPVVAGNNLTVPAQVFALFLVDSQAGAVSHVMERIQIQNGLITEVEILNCAAAGIRLDGSKETTKNMLGAIYYLKAGLANTRNICARNSLQTETTSVP